MWVEEFIQPCTLNMNLPYIFKIHLTRTAYQLGWSSVGSLPCYSHSTQYSILEKKGEVPQDMEDANIVTLYKNKGDRSDCNNYRWISLLSIVGNIHWAEYKCCFPHDEFSRPWITYTLWYVRSIQKKMIAKLCSGLRSYGPLKYVTTAKIAIFVY